MEHPIEGTERSPRVGDEGGSDLNDRVSSTGPWQEFAGASTRDAFCQNWLALQCQMVGNVENSVVLLGKADEGPFVPAACWPEPRRNIQHLVEAADRALTERCGVVLKRTPQGSVESSSGDRYEVAYPVQVEGRLYGALVLELFGVAESDLQGAMRQLQWGVAWVGVLIRREDTLKDSAIRRRLQTVLAVVARIQEHQRFYAGAMGFVTEL